MNEGYILLSRDLLESWIWKLGKKKNCMFQLLLNLFLNADDETHILTRNIDSLAAENNCNKKQILNALKIFSDLGYIDVYKSLSKKCVIIACRKNEYMTFDGEEVYFDDKELYKFPTLKGRTEAGYSKWRISCLERDDYTCQKCGSKENLCVHHIKPYAQYPKLRTQISNGITLCQECHKYEHSKEKKVCKMDI